MGQVERIDAPGATWVTYDGPPYIDPLDGRRGPFVDLCMSLTDAELVELCRYWEWRADRAGRDIDRWWCWTVVRFARRVLAGRGEARQAGRMPF